MLTDSRLMRCLSFGVALAALSLTGSAPCSAENPDIREIGSLVLDGVPEIPQRIVDRMNQYVNVRGAGFSDWAPQGGILISTRFGDTSQLHHVAVPGGARRQLTFYNEPVGGGSFGKDPNWLIFGRDAGGNENSQVYRLDLKTGKATMLTKGVGQNGDLLWNNADDRIAFRSTTRNSKDHDIWWMDPLQPEKQEILLETSGYWVPLDFSPDDSQLLVSNYISANESYVYVVDCKTRGKKPVGNHGKVNGATIAYDDANFDATGRGVYFVSDEGSEFKQLRHVKLGETKSRSLTSGISHDVVGFTLSEDRKQLAYIVNHDGTSRLHLMNLADEKSREIPVPFGVVGGVRFSPDGKTLSASINTPSSPTDVYTIDLATGEKTRWTTSEVGGLDPATFATCEIIRYPTFDDEKKGARRTIPALIYKPKGQGPFPVILNIHGGPEGQSSATFSSAAQYAVNELGCAVIYPNVRGSEGFGKTFLAMDNGYKREDSVKDIGALLDWIATQPDLDAKRVGVIGGSYGGYMTLACLVHYSDRIRAGIDNVGISNFVTFLENTSEYRRDLRRVEYGDERDPKMRKFMEEISPSNRVDKINSPLFVIQGANDPRVPQSEAEQIVKAVRGKGKTAWYMLGKDEGHGFGKKANLDQMGYAVSLFWEMFLIGDGTAAAGTK